MENKFNKTMRKVEALIAELGRLSSTIIDLSGPVNSTLVSEFEQNNNVILPTGLVMV